MIILDRATIHTKMYSAEKNTKTKDKKEITKQTNNAFFLFPKDWRQVGGFL